MRAFRSKSERAARQAELEQHDREHAERFAAATAKARKGPMRCPRCRAWLPSTATRCDYCESVDLARRNPDVTPAPPGSEAPDEAAFGTAVDSFLRGIPGG
jgi:hypothetical protein